ncbi:MAG: hypothetical protein KatS3mg110_0204 [Pirellulaceae bacterium]|nr:MAG: hypothetical protein KatS3mg110_0204 [Pirellulaceae bacterium]
MVSYREHFWRVGSVWVGLVALGLASVRAERPTAPHLLPEKTLAYVRVASFPEAVEAFRNTSLGKILQDEQMRPLVARLYQSASEAFDQIKDRVGLSLDELLQLPQGEACLALVEAPQGPPVLVVIFDAGEKMPLAEKLLGRLYEELGAQGRAIQIDEHAGTRITHFPGLLGNAPLCIWDRDGTVVLTSNLELAKQMIDLWPGTADVRTLADNPAFAAIMKQSVGTQEERPQLSWFVDPIGIFRNVARGNFTLQAGLTLVTPLGLDGVEGIGGSWIMATEEFDSISHLHILVRSPRRAIPKMIALVAGDNEPESWVPKDVVTYMTLHWDFQTTLSELTSIYDLIRLEEGAFARLLEERVSTPLGVDFQKELVPVLEGRVTFATLIERPIRLNSQVTVVGIKVKDAAKAESLLARIVAKFPEVFEKQAYGTATVYRIRVPERPRPEADGQMIRTPEPALAMVGDYVLLTDSIKALQQCLATQRTPGQSLADDLEYKLVASRIARHVGGRTPALVAFARPEESMRFLYELATAETSRRRLSQAAENNGFFRAIDSALQEHPLPPFEVIAKYLAPSGSVMVSDETGFHYVAFALKRE